MKKIFLNLSFLFLVVFANGQYISRVLEYTPAPGQFINVDPWGMPDNGTNSASIVGRLNGAMTLGAFGGYVIFKFDDEVENHKDNPYGVDFVIYGNPLKGSGYDRVTWSEPAVVWVMKDENKNGKPDDTWYELAGSDYFFSTTIKNYAVTYTNPKKSVATDVPWVDNKGKKGSVKANSFHDQEYYPMSSNFPDINNDSYTLNGTMIESNVDKSNPSYVISYDRKWGYADNTLRKSYNGLPDNPYTADVEGSGGDAFDINWAVDANGKYVDLDAIDFVKVQNSVLADAGWLGEISTEITGAFDVGENAGVTGELDMIQIKEIWDTIYTPVTQLEIFAYHKGRYLPNKEITCAVDKDYAIIDESNFFIAKKSGEFNVSVAFSDRPEIVTKLKLNVKILEIEEKLKDTIVASNVEPLNINLSNLFIDPDNDEAEIKLSIDNNFDHDVVLPTITNDELKIKVLKKGSTNITIKGQSNKKQGLAIMNITVNSPKTDLKIGEHIENLALKMEQGDTNIYLSKLFVDGEGNTDKIKISIDENTKPEVAKVELKDSTLTINCLSAGKTNITLKGTLYDDEIFETFNIAVDTPSPKLKISKHIQDLTFKVDDENTNIDLSELFVDGEGNSDKIKIELEKNTKPEVAKVEVKGKTLTISSLSVGKTSVILKGSLDDETIFETFNIEVNLPDVKLKISKHIQDLTLKMGSEDTNIDLSELFVDEEGNTDKIKIEVEKNSKSEVAKVKIKDKTLTVSCLFVGKTSITLKGTLYDKTIFETFNIEVKKVESGVVDNNKILPSIYPNPAQNYIKITNLNNVRIDILSVTGKRLQTVDKYYKNEQINIGNLQSGVYFINIISSNKHYVVRFIKQ